MVIYCPKGAIYWNLKNREIQQQYQKRNYMNKGQVAIDLLFAVILFLVIVTFFLNYVNDLNQTTDDYISNVSLFNSYILTYDLVKSTDYIKDINVIFYFKDINFSYDTTNKRIILDENNNYIISTKNIFYKPQIKACGK